MSDLKKNPPMTTTSTIAGKKVTVATPADVQASSARLKVKYSKALEILKNR